ncbi:McrC family protein [Candidatus Laterigemmans baculatus]|uniref:McrC family protein n=1 Tax=Candidatus Laterigemmans baculatus TaxID=2770505 RepID=UPI0013DB4F68|nr:restriction endonuclease [Candidatus Laterigemmans baculatus]
MLRESGMLELTELRHGLRVQAFSHVGRVRIADLSVTVLPKLSASSMLRLLRYAYGYRRLSLISEAVHQVEVCGFEDLLVRQLNDEARELLSRGLQRAYVGRNERLASPRGRIDISQLALEGGRVTATLPCRHFPRIEDTLLNRVLSAGLQLAAAATESIELRRECRRLASLIEEQVSPVRLNSFVMNQVERKMNRLTSAYGPAMSIIRLLLEAQGVTLEGETQSHRLPGFLFDMNAFFQALMLRFLRDNLPGCGVRDEQSLKGMMRYQPDFNPRKRKSPTPRPDYIVMQGKSLRAILDAKYRDLWATSLPRDMLYQLVVYAMSHRQQPESAIIYPTADPQAREARIEVKDPVSGNRIGQVSLRPVHLGRLEQLVTASTAEARRQREQYASRLAFGAK